MAHKRIVVKIGSSLLTDQTRLTPRWGFMQRIMEDFALLRDQGYDILLCSSGSVALGMKMMGVTPENAGLRDKQASAACGMPLLLNAYKQIGHEYDLNIAQILVTLGDFEIHSRFLNTKNTLVRLLEAGVVPIINENDTITTEEIRVGDNDRLAAKVAQMVLAEHLIILTSVDGLYDQDPSNPDAKLVEEVQDVSQYLSVTEGVSTLGSGGMLTKLQAANMAQNSGCHTIIANGEADSPISSALFGDRPRTICPAHSEPLATWHAWLSERLHIAGSIVINSDAADAVDAGERGVHREDVIRIEGSYHKGDVIHIYDEAGKERARGMSDFTSEETEILVRNLDIPVKQLLGYHSRAVLVEHTNLTTLDERHLPWERPEPAKQARFEPFPNESR
ncbi:glutamate 5-kinase [Aurantiacibacter xanthus]|uniref:Glutamate 5-kinase n=1 Tax=Aurantiacibacter xanthus TaxID=1784712 RepID=A0A3A1PKM2_9SPHN|nr:glutamate 5-kinase [Aurantiacibacter xanthus]RIV93352.1 glutamate 5-kinase [Aurantiacibacter xanthus]